MRGPKYVLPRRVKFYRQWLFTRYILDFYAPAVKLAIEIDGGIHETRGQKEYDKIRTDFLEANELKVIRFTNEEILERADDCEWAGGVRVLSEQALMKIVFCYWEGAKGI